MKTLKRWKSVFSSAGFALLIFLLLHWLASPDYSDERMLIRSVIFCLAVMFFLASLVLGIVKKALAEESNR